jgi:hypothetical protein|tara:strand:+ start:143 stop:433 length:291 start_codon:yes stop_codon:yes gene_type:complete
MAIRQAASEMGRKLGDESLVVAGTAIGLASIATNAVAAMITNGAEPIRVRWGTPTSSVGHYLNPYSTLELVNDDLSVVKFIRISSSSTIFVTYFGA